MAAQTDLFQLPGNSPVSASAPAVDLAFATDSEQTDPPASTRAVMAYKIGDRGPAGGIIFYDKGDNADGWQYLEAAPNDIDIAQWGTSGYDAGKTGTAVGTGKENTRLIALYLKRTGESEGAAALCDALMVNDYDDWFLPSLDELDLMYRVLWEQAALGGFKNDSWYWSSSQYYHYNAWAQRFSDGSRSRYAKYCRYSVRAVRAF
jgi:hypothetical protein